MRNCCGLHICLLLCLLNNSACTQTAPKQENEEKENKPPVEVKLEVPEKAHFSWLKDYNPQNALLNRIPAPNSYQRVEEKNTFTEWLQWLPISPNDKTVTLYNGEEKRNQTAQHAIVNIDVGDKDLQQCADAVMRMRAEYLFASNQEEKISFNFTSGHAAKWLEWKKGKRPVISGNKVSWVQKASEDGSYPNFKKYLNSVFTYAGTSSLSKEMQPIDLSDIQAGDVLIKGGFPGHAVLVVDVAVNDKNEKVFLIAQSYMPAQEFHVLKNPTNPELSPWYKVSDYSNTIATPEWNFTVDDLMRFRN